MKVFIWLLSVSSAFLLIAYVFWQQEIQYWTPTVKPAGVTEVSIGERVSIQSLENLFLFPSLYMFISSMWIVLVPGLI